MNKEYQRRRLVGFGFPKIEHLFVVGAVVDVAERGRNPHRLRILSGPKRLELFDELTVCAFGYRAIRNAFIRLSMECPRGQKEQRQPGAYGFEMHFVLWLVWNGSLPTCLRLRCQFFDQ